MVEVLFIFGLILYFIGAIGLLIDEFKTGCLWGLCGLLFPITNYVFAIIHFQECKRSLFCIVSGALLMIGSVILSCLAV